MLLTRIARDVWDVLAFTESGQCQVIQHLEGLEQEESRLYREVAAFLLKDLPAHGPPPKAKGAKAMVPSIKELKGGVWEFRLGRRPDPAYRVLWFHGSPLRKTIICTRAFTKRDESTPEGVIDESIDILHQYRLEAETFKGEPS